VTDTGAIQPVQIIRLDDISIATSGDYRNFYEIDGQTYSHVINPETGRPVNHNLASVTVLHPSNMMADAFATMFLVMGADKTITYAEQQKLPVFLVLRKGDALEYRQSSRFNDFVVKQ
jgi:thiamine biosynthesis lipoprotein